MQATPAAIMAIAAGVRAALGRRGKIRPVALKRPITLEVEITRTARTDRAVMISGGERVGARGIRYTAPDMAVAYKVFRLIAHLAGG